MSSGTAPHSARGAMSSYTAKVVASGGHSSTPWSRTRARIRHRLRGHDWVPYIEDSEVGTQLSLICWDCAARIDVP